MVVEAIFNIIMHVSMYKLVLRYNWAILVMIQMPNFKINLFVQNQDA